LSILQLFDAECLENPTRGRGESLLRHCVVATVQSIKTALKQLETVKKMKTAAGLIPTIVIAVFVTVRSPAAEPDTKIDSVGKPKAFKVGKEACFALWFADGQWHVRGTVKKGDFAKLQGSVKLDAGEITDGNFEQMETKSKKRDHDSVSLDHDKQGFHFFFDNAGSADGLDFKATGAAKTVTFGMLIDGHPSTENILIGSKGVHPATNPFTLPAHPVEAADKPAGK